VSKVHQGAVIRRADLFGGSGTVDIYDLLEGRGMPPFAAVLSCELAPSGTVGAHRQEHCPELVIVLEGEGEATVNGRPQPLSPGSVVRLPLGSVLTLANHRDDAPLCYLIVKAR
jgi:quercetin dioxygenase-like cupin family protein